MITDIKHLSEQMKEIRRLGNPNLRVRQDINNKVIEKLMIEINHDMELKQQEQIKYQRKEKQLKKEIANVSHDLRTPLTSILGYAELLKDDISQEERAGYIRIIEKRAKVLQTLITSFYDLSRIESEDYVMQMEKVNLRDVLCDTLLGFYEAFEKKHIKVEMNLQDNSSEILLDYNSIVRILTNLIQNALKYSSKYFKVKLIQEDESTVMIFSNDTDQITQAKLPYIFNRTYTGDSSRNEKNTGLGLTIAKTLVEKMGGRIEADMDNDEIMIKVSFQN